MVEAAKAGFPLYRPVLSALLGLSRMSPRGRLAVASVAVLICMGLSELGDQVPTMSWTFWPMTMALFGFVMLASPFSNLVLRLHPFGRLALTDDQLAASNWTGLCVLVLVAGVVLHLLFPSEAAFLLALLGFCMILPVTVVFRCRPGRERRTMGLAAVGLALVGLACVGLALLTKPSPMVIAFATGWLAFEFYGLIRRRRRIG